MLHVTICPIPTLLLWSNRLRSALFISATNVLFASLSLCVYLVFPYLANRLIASYLSDLKVSSMLPFVQCQRCYFRFNLTRSALFISSTNVLLSFLAATKLGGVSPLCLESLERRRGRKHREGFERKRKRGIVS